MTYAVRRIDGRWAVIGHGRIVAVRQQWIVALTIAKQRTRHDHRL